MTDEEKIKLQKVVGTLKVIYSKVKNLKTNINEISKTLEENLEMDDKKNINQKFKSINNTLTVSGNTIKDSIIPKIKNKIKI